MDQIMGVIMSEFLLNSTRKGGGVRRACAILADEWKILVWITGDRSETIILTSLVACNVFSDMTSTLRTLLPLIILKEI